LKVSLSFSGVLGCQPHSRYRVPHRKPFLQYFAVTMSRQAVATGTKVATNQTERGKKPLRLTSRFEATHRSFALTCSLMGILGPIVETFLLSVLHTGQYLLFCRAIAPQLIRDQHAWNILTEGEQLPKEPLGSLFVPVALHQDILHVARLIDRSPQLVQFASDCKKHLIEVPCITALRTPSTQLVSTVLAKFLAPLTNRLVGQHDPTLGHQLFDIAIAKREAIVEPDRVRDDLGRKAIALVGV
jgi:hypothetical protein